VSQLSIIAKMLILAGIVLLAIGLLLLIFHKIPYLGKLPGDIYIRRENFSFYFPLASCILISLAVSFLLWIIFRR
jgi:hypothetical protein